MKITPIEIRQKEFQKAFRGIDRDEVKAFLLSLSQEWEHVLDESKELRFRLEGSERELDKLRERENSVFKTMKTAEEAGANMIEQTKKETELQLKASKLQSEEIVNEARARSKSIIENADQKSRAILNEMMDKIKSLESNYNHLFDQREKLINQLKNFIRDNGEKIEKLTRQIPDKESQKMAKNAMDLFNSNVAAKSEIQPVAENEEIQPPAVQHQAETVKNEVVEISKSDQSKKSFFDEIE